MRIIKREDICLSRKENDAFTFVDEILEGLLREADNPSLIDAIEKAQLALNDVYDYITEVEEC